MRAEEDGIGGDLNLRCIRWIERKMRLYMLGRVAERGRERPVQWTVPVKESAVLPVRRVEPVPRRQSRGRTERRRLLARTAARHAEHASTLQTDRHLLEHAGLEHGLMPSQQLHVLDLGW